MSSSLHTLRPHEHTRVLPDPVDLLLSELGPHSGRELIERAAFEVSDKLLTLDAALEDGDLDQAEQITDLLGAVSGNIGMVKFAMIARSLRDCIQRGDMVALTAVNRRLQRVGEASIFEVVDLADMPLRH